MKLRQALIFLSSILFMAGCSHVEEPDVPDNTPDPVIVEEGDSVAIRFGISLGASVTKGVGPLDSFNGTQDLYIYGIAREGFDNAATIDAPLDLTPGGILMNNAKAEHSNPVVVYRYPDTQEYYYYGFNRRYEFFGYYVDDAAVDPSPTVGDTAVTLPIKIDGSQDILLASTDKLSDIAAAQPVNPVTLYSNYSAKRGIVPNLRFRHQLSRFNISVLCGSGERMVDKLRFDHFRVESMSEGTLVIATKQNKEPGGIVDRSNLDSLDVWRNGHALSLADDIGPTLSWTDLGSVMVMPGSSHYMMHIGFWQSDVTVDNGLFEASYDIDLSKLGTGTAQPGYQYNIKVVVYGLEDIRVTVGLAPWEDAPGTTIDPDDNQSVPVTDITLSKTSLVLEPGATEFLEAEVSPANATNPSVTWSSSDPSVATVDQTGRVTAVTVGSATISAKAGSVTKKCEVTVYTNTLSGIFSVGPNRKVHFSRGNLQYTRGNSNPWGFAEKQYEIVGDTDSNIYYDTSPGSKVDLFCWSGNSWSNYGLSTNDASGYYDGMFLDWGAKIDHIETWRTLSEDEWRYLIGTSTERDGKYKNWVNVNGVNGLVLAPDDFTGTITDSYDASTWAVAENDGLVFLPISGYRYHNYVTYLTNHGYYWSSTSSSRYNACASVLYMGYNSSSGEYYLGVANNTTYRRYACCVRLVSDIVSPIAVDLGLSVKWASCNVGARNPFGLGQYYAWGETVGFEEEDITNTQNYQHDHTYFKNTYYGDTYKFYVGDYPDYTATKYYEGDNLMELEPEDDPATVNWGADWRTPTREEMEELLDPNNCSWTWYGPTNSLPGVVSPPEFNGVSGYKVQSLKPGYTDNYIFLPVSGYRSSASSGGIRNVAVNILYDGYYWTSTRLEGSIYDAGCLHINAGENSAIWFNRAYGISIRPVTE